MQLASQIVGLSHLSANKRGNWNRYMKFITIDLLNLLSSPYHITAVCDLIPESLDGADLETIGYHRQCYQRFAVTLSLLKDATRTSTSQKHHSPPKAVDKEFSTPFPLNVCSVGILKQS